MSKLLSYLGILICFVFISCGDGKSPSNEQKPIDGNTTVDSTNQSGVQVEEYKEISAEEVDKLNQTIAEKQLSNSDEIMRAYLPEAATSEKGYRYTIREINSQNSPSTLVSLTVEGNNHESVQSIKVIMSILKKEGKLVVTQIKESYRCWEGKGHQEWSAYPCA